MEFLDQASGVAQDLHLYWPALTSLTSLDLTDAAAVTGDAAAATQGFQLPSNPFADFHPFAPLGAGWTAWRSFVQNSIVTLHDFIYSMGLKENAYGLAIMLFTIGCRGATLPLLWVQYSSQEKMKAMQPYILEIKERYKDPNTQNLMIAKLYEDTDSNPLAGCLPALVQIPIFIALYRSILNLANDNLLEEPFLWLPSLEGPTLTEQLQLPNGRGLQWLSEGWHGSFLDGTLEPFLGWDDTLSYLAIPIFLTLSQILTMRIMSPSQESDDPTVQRTQAILKYIPFMIGYFSLQVPAALCLYWLSSNVFSSATTVGIKKYWEANPPSVEWEYLEEQTKSSLGKSVFQLDLPANMEEAIADARLNLRPPRTPRRATYLASAAAGPTTSPQEGVPALSVEEVLSTGASPGGGSE